MSATCQCWLNLFQIPCVKILLLRALITGITGFVGTYLAEHLLASGWDVAGLSRHGKWHPRSDAALRDVPMMNWDIQQEASDSVVRWIKDWKAEVTFHFAAVSIPADCGQPDPNEEAWKTNVEGTSRILKLFEDQALSGRLILTSSCHVYAPMESGQERVSEDATIGPSNGYGKTKLEAERLVTEAHKEKALDSVIVRGFQVTGPRQSARMILPEWTKQFAEQLDPVSIRTLNTSLDLMDVRDSARALRLIAEQVPAGSCLNVGSGRATHGADLIEELKQAAGYEPQLNEASPGTRMNPIADVRLLKKLTGFEPTIPLAKTVRDTYDFFCTES